MTRESQWGRTKRCGIEFKDAAALLSKTVRQALDRFAPVGEVRSHGIGPGEEETRHASVEFRQAFAVGASISFRWDWSYEPIKGTPDGVEAYGVQLAVEVNAGSTNRSVAEAAAQHQIYGQAIEIARAVETVVNGAGPVYRIRDSKS